MVLVLPDEGISAEDLALSLNIAIWDDWMEALSPAKLHLRMPRFELAFDTEDMMMPVLTRMGMGIAFDSQRADFSNISEIPLFIDMVKQSACIQVDEEGTKAAAVTIVESESLLRDRARNYPFHVDRPFCFLLKRKAQEPFVFGTYQKIVT